MAAAFDEVIGPAAERFQPDIILVRAAFLILVSAQMKAPVAKISDYIMPPLNLWKCRLPTHLRCVLLAGKCRL